MTPPKARRVVEMTAAEYVQAARDNWSEDKFTREVINLAQQCGWRAVHFDKGKAASGRWLTVMIGNKGWPDVFAAKSGRLVAMELKVGDNKPTEDQKLWLAALESADTECYVFWPRDWDQIVRVFGGQS